MSVEEILPVDSMTPDEAAAYVTEAWRGSVAAIVLTGRRLLEARSRVPEGQWLQAVEKMPFGERTAQQIMRVAEHPDLDASHDSGLDRLPRDYNTLSILAGLPEGQVTAHIQAGAITPELDRRQARDLVRSVNAAKAQGLSEPVGDPVLRLNERGTLITLALHDGTTVDVPAPASTPTFNHTNDLVDWARWTWNPVTGCLHGCAYCYAWEIAESSSRAFPVGFKPVLRHERLDAPAHTRFPGDSSDPREQRVFVCSMADLFGEWVPQEWIERVMDACKGEPSWEYLFLTKFPQRYKRLALPPACWLGTSVDGQRRVKVAEKAMREAPDCRVKWLSIEPLREAITFSDLSWCDWMVIGAQTANHGEPALAPEIDWVVSLMAQARAASVPVYLKPNLLGVVGPKAPGMTLVQEAPRSISKL